MERLIEKYFQLPNTVWDSIIQQATKVSLQVGLVLLWIQVHFVFEWFVSLSSTS